jgi:hypothetical protein
VPSCGCAPWTGRRRSDRNGTATATVGTSGATSDSVLPPRSLNGREIIFEVHGNVDLTRFRLSLHPGVAEQTQDWRLT